ncbi:hypothetical protein [Dactylosporangium sp. CA-233914]|uniref:hypothetical protein n=1 Tax=Dactylosporangium sp. CA-233914 TaxID=3239934 RepID=UPI003D902916
MVETTTIPRAAIDTAWEEYEEALRAAVRRIELEFDVTCLIDLTSHMVEDETQAWLDAVRLIAAHTDGEPGNQVVPSEIGTITICRGLIPAGTALFAGAVQERDEWHRLGRTLAAKSQQVAGPLPAWIRVDCLDGLFQFTGWARMEAESRLDAIAAEIRDRVAWSDNAEGIVLSSGPAVFTGGDDPAMAATTITTSACTFLRRVIAPNLIRESFIVPLRAGVDERRAWWSHAYGNEPEWLDADLRRARQPRLAELWKTQTFERTA